MYSRNKTWAGVLSLVVIVSLAPSVFAQKKNFDGVVEHIEKNYNGRRTKIPMLGLANFIIRIIIFSTDDIKTVLKFAKLDPS